MKDSKNLLQFLSGLTVGSCILIVIVAIIFSIYILYQKNKHQLNIHRQWVEQMPTIVSTLGVLGTFLGITVGLYYFDPKNLDDSIPLLLSGLKTAFVTSLAGMTGSLILTRIINRCFDEVDSQELEQDKMLRLVTALSSIQTYLTGDEIKQFRNSLTSSFDKVSDNLSDTYQLLEGIGNDIQQMKDDIEELKGQCNEIRENMQGETADTTQIKRLIGIVTTATESLERMDDSISDIKDMSKGISDNVSNYADELEEIRDCLSGD